MFDLGGGELLVIGIVALVVIGPKELPGLLRTIGQALGKLRRMAGVFQGQFNDAMKEADLSETQKVLTDIHSTVRSKFDIRKIGEVAETQTVSSDPQRSADDGRVEQAEVPFPPLPLVGEELSDASEIAPLIVAEPENDAGVEQKKSKRKKTAVVAVSDHQNLDAEETK